MPHTRPISKRMFWTILAALGVAVAVASFGLRYSAPSAEAAKISIDVGSLWFCDSSSENGVCETTIDIGDTVSWQFLGLHTTTSDDGLWSSGNLNSGQTFEYTFDSPGTFDYRCTIHPIPMKGRIIVTGAAPTPSPTPEDTPVPTATDVPAPTATETAVPTTTPTPGVTPVLTPSATVTPTTTGTFVAPPTVTITPTPTPSPTAPPPGTVGDASGNGTVDSIDALLVLQFVAALLPDLPSEMNADANQNGTVDAIDATLILQFVAGLISMLPP